MELKQSEDNILFPPLPKNGGRNWITREELLLHPHTVALEKRIIAVLRSERLHYIEAPTTEDDLEHNRNVLLQSFFFMWLVPKDDQVVPIVGDDKLRVDIAWTAIRTLTERFGVQAVFERCHVGFGSTRRPLFSLDSGDRSMYDPEKMLNKRPATTPDYSVKPWSISQALKNKE